MHTHTLSLSHTHTNTHTHTHTHTNTHTHTHTHTHSHTHTHTHTWATTWDFNGYPTLCVWSNVRIRSFGCTCKKGVSVSVLVCGCVCVCVCMHAGIDHFLTSAGTLSTCNAAWPIRELNRSTSPVVRCAVCLTCV